MWSVDFSFQFYKAITYYTFITILSLKRDRNHKSTYWNDFNTSLVMFILHGYSSVKLIFSACESMNLETLKHFNKLLKIKSYSYWWNSGLNIYF